MVASAATVADPATLTLRGLVKRWPSASAPVLDGLDLSLEPGSAAAVRGRNGAGKTTLLRIVAGLIAADAGTVKVGGLDAERDRRAFQRRIGFVSAGNAALYARLTVDDHLGLYARLALLPSAEARAARLRMHQAFALEELRRQRVDRLSTGQRQRLRLSLGFLHEPQVVLLDEPAVSLDESARKLLDAAISGVRERGGVAVLCGPTGSEELLDVSDRYHLSRGRLERA